MSSSYWDTKGINLALSKVQSARVRLLSEFRSAINDYYGWNESNRFYDIIAGDWLEHFSHHILFAFEQDSYTHTDFTPLTIPVSSDTFKYFSVMEEAPLHDHYRRAVGQLMCGGCVDSWIFSDQSLDIRYTSKISISERILNHFMTSHPDVLFVGGRFKNSKLDVFLTFFRWRKWASFSTLRFPFQFSIDVNTQWRLLRASVYLTSFDYIDVMCKLLPLYIPVALLEGLGKYRTFLDSLHLYRPKAVYSCNYLYGNLTFKILVANWVLLGTKLLYHQHGGCYGIDRQHVLELYETRVADFYYTWGWSVPGNSKVRSLILPPCSIPKCQRKFILLNCGDYPDNLYRIQYQPMGSFVDQFRQETCSFLSKLSDTSNLLIRPYFYDYSGRFVRSMQDSAPGVPIDDHRIGSIKRFAQSKIVVHNYLGTSYLETLSLNIPTVCFYDADYYLCRDTIKPLFDALENVGIIHRNALSAAQFVDSIAVNPSSWWFRNDVQEARRLFVKEFVTDSSNWRQVWERELQSVLRSTLPFSCDL